MNRVVHEDSVLAFVYNITQRNLRSVEEASDDVMTEASETTEVANIHVRSSL